MSSRPVCRLVALIAVFLIALPAHARDWLRAETPHFVIYSEGSAAETRAFALDVERFDTLLRRMFKAPDHQDGDRLVIYMLQSAGTVARLYGQRYVAGFYSPSAEGSFAVTNRAKTADKSALTGQITLFHEYAHHFMYRNFANAYPAWYSEGFAEFVSTADFDKDGNWRYGYPAMHRAASLLTTQLPIEKILFSTRYQFKNSEQADFYAWSWLLVHMLSWDKARAGQLTEYLNRFARGESPEQAATAFGDLTLLESDMRKYAGGRLSYIASGAPLEWDGAIRIAPLDPIASELIELGLARKTGAAPDKTRDALRALAARAPGNADVLVELARAERDTAARMKDPAGFVIAEGVADKALALTPGPLQVNTQANVQANVLKAELAFYRLRKTRDADPAKWKAARAYITAANRADPSSPLPLIAYFRSFAAEGRQPTRLALDSIASAFAKQPESREVRLLYAFGLAADKQFDKARQLLTVIAYDPHAAEVGRKALETTAQMEKSSADPAAAMKAVEEGSESAGDQGGQPPVSRRSSSRLIASP